MLHLDGCMHDLLVVVLLFSHLILFSKAVTGKKPMTLDAGWDTVQPRMGTLLRCLIRPLLPASLTASWCFHAGVCMISMISRSLCSRRCHARLFFSPALLPFAWQLGSAVSDERLNLSQLPAGGVHFNCPLSVHFSLRGLLGEPSNRRSKQIKSVGWFSVIECYTQQSGVSSGDLFIYFFT